jgi:hypothetical protein
MKHPPSLFPQFDQAVYTPPATVKPDTPLVTEIKRRSKSKVLILARLEQGPATNEELNEICYRYGARIWELKRELKREGVTIEKENLSGGLWSYRLARD